MFNNSSKIMFFSIMMLGTLISISANSWLSAWMGLEINLLSFIPLMSDNKLMSTESSLKYFLTQALASAVLLFVMILFLLNFNMMNMNVLQMMIFSSLILKLGAAPFHFWFPNVMEGLSWINSLVLMTVQKIAPLILISYIMLKSLMLISIILSSIIGALGGLNQTSLRKLMAYSSINHLSWMLISLYNSNLMCMIYFSFYMFLNFSLIFLFNLFKISHMNQLFSLNFNSKFMKFMLLMNLLSLGGLPPFLGFLPKWMIIQSLTMNNQLFLLMVMIFMTLITLYFYIRLCYSSFMLNNYENNWLLHSMYNYKLMKLMLFTSFFSLFSLFLIYPLVYFY